MTDKRSKKGPLVSIVTPSYNQGRFIEETILSVKNQDYPNIEHIIVDGGSTDETIEILKKYEGTYNMRWISEPDKGQADAVNKGFRLSSGDIIGWQNSDDLYTPSAISKAVEYFQKYPQIDLVFGDFYFINEQGDIIQEVRLRPFDKREYLYVGPNITNQSAFWRRELFLKTGGLNTKYRYAMDFDFFVRASEKGRFMHVRELLGCLRIHGKSKTITKGGAKQWMQEYADIRERYGIHMDLDIPWSQQYKARKLYFKLRRLYYYIVEGNIDYLWKKFRRHQLVQQWNKDDNYFSVDQGQE